MQPDFSQRWFWWCWIHVELQWIVFRQFSWLCFTLCFPLIDPRWKRHINYKIVATNTTMTKQNNKQIAKNRKKKQNANCFYLKHVQGICLFMLLEKFLRISITVLCWCTMEKSQWTATQSVVIELFNKLSVSKYYTPPFFSMVSLYSRLSFTLANISKMIQYKME